MYLSKIKNSFIILSLFLFFFSNQIFSQVNPDVSFYPLHVGDIRQYLVEHKYTDATKDSSYYASVYVRGIDTLDNGKAYYIITCKVSQGC